MMASKPACGGGASGFSRGKLTLFAQTNAVNILQKIMIESLTFLNEGESL